MSSVGATALDDESASGVESGAHAVDAHNAISKKRILAFEA